MDRAGRGHADMARHPARRRELPEELPHPICILRYMWIDLRIGAFQVDIGNKRRTPMARPGEIDHRCLISFDDPVEMDVNEAQPRRSAPMPEKSGLYVLRLQWFP